MATRKKAQPQPVEERMPDDGVPVGLPAEGERQHLIEAIRLAKEQLAREARTSFRAFACVRQSMEQQPALHHLVMCEALDAVERGECDMLMIFLPPGSAKSTYGTVLFPQYFFGRNPSLSCILGSHTGDLATAFGRKIRNGIQSPEFAEIFPQVQVSADNSAKDQWSTSYGGEFLAAGVGGAIAGRRADLGLIDDPIKSREEADSDIVRERVWEWYVNDFLTRLKPGGRQVLIMTRWHEDDLAGRILERESHKWKVIKIPMIAGEKDILGRAQGERLWKEWFTDEMVERAQADPRSWISLYQQEPRPKEGAEFKRTWLNFYSNPPKVMNKLILVDPAGDPNRKTATKRKKSDFTAIWVVGLASDENAYLLDGLRDRLNLSQRTEALFALHKRWKPMHVRFEQYGLQADIEHIKGEMERRQYRFTIKEVGGAVEKNARIRRLIPWFEGGRIWLPNQMVRHTVQGTQYDVIKDFLDHEYVTFPVGRHDDSFDCLARLAEPGPGMALPFPEEDEAAMNPGAAAAWGVIDQLTGY